MSAREVILSVVREQDEEWDAPGDRWLFRPNPDEASLSCGHLTDAVLRALTAAGYCR